MPACAYGIATYISGGIRMMKTLTASTLEVDEADTAVAEILEKLDLEGNLLKNSVGILTCHADFLETGVVKALCARLPFDVVGTTTLGAATDGATDLVILTLFVLTSDDVQFATSLTEALAERQEEPIKAAYDRAAARLPEKPSLVLAYAPMLNHVGGEQLVRHMNKASGNVPVFGTLSCDHNFDFHESHIIYNGGHYRDSLAMVLLSGNVNPRFFIISTPEGNIREQNAVITESEGNVVKQINGRPVLEYLDSIGLSRENGLEGSKSIPLILDYNDGTPPVARCFYMITDEGYAVCGGDMPVDATFALSTMEYDDVIQSAEQVLARLASAGESSGMLMVSCIVRGVTLGMDQLAESKKVQDLLGHSVPYQLCYSGGEICPVYDKNGNTTNRFHNFSLAVCLF